MGQLNEDLFIEAGVDITERSPELATVINLSAPLLKKRWETSHGKYVLNRWAANNFARATLDEMVGRYHGHTDLRGIPLPKAKFENVDLSKIDFFAANFEGAEFDRANLTDSWMSHANLRHATFKWSRMESVLIDDVDFDNKTVFVGIDLGEINFTLAALLQEHALQDLRVQHLKRQNPVLAFFLSITSDYGRSFLRFAFSCLGIIALFSVTFHFSAHAVNKSDWGSSILFSFLAFLKISSANLFASSTVGKTLFISEAAIGYVMLGVLVSIIIRRTIGK